MHHHVAFGLVSAVLTIQAGLGLLPAAAAEGQLTKIGGNGLVGCEFNPAADSANPPMPSSGISGGGYRRSTGMRGIGTNLRGTARYLATPNYVLSDDRVIAGTKRGMGTEKDGEPGQATEFTDLGISSLAVDPSGNSLWVTLPSRPRTKLDTTETEKVPGRIRRIDLTNSNYPVYTVAETGPNPEAIAADIRGNLYVAEREGAVYKLDPTGAKTNLAPVSGAEGIAVDVFGQVFVSSSGGAVYRVNGTSTQVVAASSNAPLSDGSPGTFRPSGLAIGHETDGQSALYARYLYIADYQGFDLQKEVAHGRVLRVDLTASSPVITTVAGGGSAFVASAEDGKTANLGPKFLAADMNGKVYLAAPDQCAIFALQTPSPFRLNTVVTNPPAATNTTLPSGGSRTGDNESTAPDPAPAGNGNTQVDPGTGGQPASQGNQTQIVPGSQTQVQAQPQTELRVIDQGNVVTAPQQSAQPTVEPVPTPSGAAQFTPTPVQTPAPTPTPTPAGVSTAVAPDPGPTSAAIADAAPAVPAAPAVAPVPPAPASAPPPAAQQPVSNPGLVHGDSGTAPTRSATRYAMVRNDDDQPIAALAMAGAGAIVAVFSCVMFVAPGASTKPKPRPRRAY